MYRKYRYLREKTSMDMIIQFVANMREFRLRMEIMDNVIFMTGIR